MMRYLLFTFLIVFLFGSCAEKDALSQYRPEIEAPHEVEIIPEDETLVLSDLVDGYELIEPKGKLLAYMSKVLPYDTTWVVYATSIDNGYVHQLDSEGCFIRTLLKEGQGPDEAINLRGMKIYGDDLYLLVNTGVKLMHYSLKEGKFLDSFSMPDEVYGICDFEVLDKGKYIFYKEHPQVQGDEYKLYVYDQVKNQIEQRWLPMYKQAWEDYLWFGQSDCLYQFNGKYYFYEVFQKGIYEVSADELKGYVSFMDNAYTMPNDGVYNAYPSLTEFLDYCKASSYIWAHRNITESKSFILSDFMSGNEDYHWNVIDKRAWTSRSYTKIKDDMLLDTEMPLREYMYQIGVQQDVRYFCLPYDLLQKVMEQKEANGELDAYARKHPDVMELYKTMNEDSNDLIVVFHEKQ